MPHSVTHFRIVLAPGNTETNFAKAYNLVGARYYKIKGHSTTVPNSIPFSLLNDWSSDFIISLFSLINLKSTFSQPLSQITFKNFSTILDPLIFYSLSVAKFSCFSFFSFSLNLHFSESPN